VVQGERMRDIGEFAFLRRVLADLPQGPEVRVGPGDDAAVLDLPPLPVVVCTDVLVEGSHFRRDWSAARDVGRKAVAVNAADVAAMGARPVAVLAGVVAPPDVDVAWLMELAAGMQDGAADAGCSLSGGDTVAGPAITVSVSAIGVVPGATVTRAGAHAGDVVAVCGRLGYAAAGLAVLTRGFRSPRLLVDAQRCPQPPYQQGVVAAAAGATAMIDVSDGLMADLGHVAEQSGVRVTVELGRVAVPTELEQMARALGVDARTWVFGGGEDHALAACFPTAGTVPQGWDVIGRVEAGAGVDVEGWPDWSTALADGGYEHFRR
jgi:thiamine-monophosphate kinase